MRNTLGFNNLEFIEADHWRGGIAFLWKKSLDWEVIYKSKWIIGILIPKRGGGIWTRWVCYCPAEEVKEESFGVLLNLL